MSCCFRSDRIFWMDKGGGRSRLLSKSTRNSSWRPVFQQSKKILETCATIHDEEVAGGESSSPGPRHCETAT
ncbi:hypothetical protein J6590_041727 [Homalodisca vitripennis]|nr:hypothetical protein J6590_041727 [Homalodisca vitripennis]